jgi:hypothetical protein
VEPLEGARGVLAGDHISLDDPMAAAIPLLFGRLAEHRGGDDLPRLRKTCLNQTNLFQYFCFRLCQKIDERPRALDALGAEIEHRLRIQVEGRRTDTRGQPRDAPRANLRRILRSGSQMLLRGLALGFHPRNGTLPPLNDSVNTIQT